MYLCVYIYIYIYTCICVCVYVYVYTYMQMSASVNVYRFIHNIEITLCPKMETSDRQKKGTMSSN